MVKDNDELVNEYLTNKIEIIKDETRELIKEILSLLCMNDYFNDKNITLHVKRLSDGIDETDSFYERIFINGGIQSLSKNITFEELPISEKIETYKHPLVIISDENEIDEYIRQRIVKRKENALEIYPVIVFCDDFFTVREGESFGYINIIESLESACGDNCHAMPFMISDMRKNNLFLKAYIDYMDMVLHLKEANKCVEESFEYIDSVIDKLRIIIDNENKDVKKLAAITKIKNYIQYREKLIIKSNSLNEQVKKVDGIFIEIREKYDEHIYCIRKKEPLRSASSMAVHIDLKYGTFKDQLRSFLMEVRKSTLFEKNEHLCINTESLFRESFKELDSNTSELTLIGTFSSGKTTMINTFLGHRHKLHTSKDHNTAVLMQIIKKPEDEKNEYCKVIYKDKLIWSVIKPAYMETKLYRNPFPGRAKVISIRRTEQGFVVKIREMSGEKRIQDVMVGKMHKLSIYENCVVEGGASLIGNNASEKELKLASKKEVQLMIDYINEKKLIHPVIRVSCKTGEKEYRDKKALGFLEKLIECDKYNRISRESRQPMISVNDLFDLMRSEIFFATFYSDIEVENKRMELDDKGWRVFFGTEDKHLSNSNTIPFCEAPDCYMLADHINVYLDCEFLDYCSVNDTPGFGSITEEHDACTERFVSSSKSRLLAMITINSKSEDAKLYDFLNFIANVCRNFRKKQINEVYFMLNCFSNNAVEEKLRSDINKVSRLIVDLGFNKKNIYVCNLRKSTEESQEMLEMWGFPSYASFKKDCIENMLESGLVARYEEIYDSWEKYFKDNLSFVDERLNDLENNLENGENRINSCRNKIRAVNAVKNPSLDDILADVKRQYENYYEYIKSTFSSSKRGTGLFWHQRKRRDECNNIMKRIEDLISTGELEEYSEEIKKAVRKSIIELQVASGIYFVYSLDDADCTLFTLAIQNIKDKLMEADENTHWYNSVKQTSYYMKEIKNTIDTDYNKSAERARLYFGQLAKKYYDQQKRIRSILEKDLNEIDNPDSIRNSIDAIRLECDEIKRLRSIFKKTINTDILRCRNNESR